MSVQNFSNYKHFPHSHGGGPRPKRFKRLGTKFSPHSWGVVLPIADVSFYFPFISHIGGSDPLCGLLGYEEPIFSHVRGSGPSDHRFDRHQES